MAERIVYIIKFPDGYGYTSYIKDERGRWRRGSTSCGATNYSIEEIKKEQWILGKTKFIIVKCPKFPEMRQRKERIK